MQVAMAAGSILLSLVTAEKQERSYDQAAASQREMAERNAQRTEAETRERVRMQREEAVQEQSLARARAGASGALVTSQSHLDYGQGLWDTAKREIDWTQKAGESQAGITRREGELSARNTRTEGDAAWWGTVGGGIRSGMSFLGS